MKKLSIVLLCIAKLIFFTTSLSAQTLIVNPHGAGGFELGNTFEANGWTLVNYAPGTGNNWRLTTTDLSNGAYSFARTGSRAAYISQSNSGTNWSYNINVYSTTHFYRDVYFPEGEELIYLDFRWNAQGEGTMTSSYDVLYVYLCPTTLTPVTHSPFGTSSSPTAWVGTGSATLIGSYHTNPSLSGKSEHITLPSSYAGTHQRLVFTWKNGNTLGVQPPAAVDSVSLRSDCHKPQLFLTNASAPCTNNINITSTVYFGEPTGTFQWYVNNILVPSATSSTFNSTTLNNGDIVKCVYHANNACAYTDTATLVVNYGLAVTHRDTLNLCTQDLPFVWNGYTIPASLTAGQYSNYRHVVFPKEDGCDSTVYLDLKISTTPPPITETISTCRALLDGMTWRGKTIPTDAKSSSKYDSVIVSNPSGCDSIIYLNLQIIDSTEQEIISLVGCDKVNFRGKTYYTSATIIDTFRNLSGCDSFYRIHEIIVDTFLIRIIDNNPVLIENTYATLNLEANTSQYNVLSWTPTHLFPIQNNKQQDFLLPLHVEVVVIAQNENGCLDTAKITLNSTPFEKDIAIPNAFSPNGDGLNDVFRPSFAMQPNFHQIHLVVFDRWGNKVHDHFSNSELMGWDGMYQGKPVPAGVYYYKLIVYYMDYTQAEFTGDVTLIR